MRVLLVEDDPKLAALIRGGLEGDGMAVDHAADAAQGQALAEMESYAVLLLDVRLPEGGDAGFELARTLRSAGLEAPIVFLTARDDVEDVERGLDTGGDDYLTKPFALRELRARIRAVVRRARGVADPRLPLAGGWRLDTAGRRAVRGSRTAAVTRREYALLELLALHPGRVFSRGELVDRLWAGTEVVDLKVIDVYVSSLRRKLVPEVIATVRGFGYRLGAEDAAPADAGRRSEP